MKKSVKILITGGAGFIGVNAAKYFLKAGCEVIIVDNLSRKGTHLNLEYLKKNWNFEYHKADIRQYSELLPIFQKHRDLTAVLHLAGQVAVTTSILNPREDMEINILGTFNVLEAVRETDQKPLVIFSSTNKVYGGLESVQIREGKQRYELVDLPFGVPESMLLDFHSPYGVSKGSADQYVHDYSRIYGIPTLVIRQSCIYGPHQFGVEDQGWVAWFLIASLLNKPLTIYGNGKQVRDLLHVHDLVKLYDLAIQHSDKAAGQIINAGGGPDNIMSVWTDFSLILADLNIKPKVSTGDWRAGDQPIYVSDIRKAEALFGWQPKISVKTGIIELSSWIKENLSVIRRIFES